MIDKLIDKYGTILNTLRENKSTKSKTATYDYNTDIKNTREYLKDLKALKKQLTIPVVVKSFYCDNKHNNIPNMNCERQCWFCREQENKKQ